MGIVGLWDKSERPVFPRWVCGWAIFTGLPFLPLTIMPFYKTGGLAWNGWFSFWALLTIYLFWTFSTGVCMVRDASRRLREFSMTSSARSFQTNQAGAAS